MFHGFKKFSPGQKEPEEFVEIVTKHQIRLQNGDTSVTAYYGFDSEEQRDNVIRDRDISLGLACDVNPLGNITGRNYLLEVKYPKRVSYDSAVEDALILRKKYQASDVSMVPIPMSLSEKLYKAYGNEGCPFLAMLQY